MDDGLREQRCGGGAVAGCIVCLSRNLADELRAHVLERILQLHVLGDGHAVVGDERSAVLLAEHNVAALRAEGDLYGIGELIDAGLKGLAGILTIDDLFCHNALHSFIDGRLSVIPQQPECRKPCR